MIKDPSFVDKLQALRATWRPLDSSTGSSLQHPLVVSIYPPTPRNCKWKTTSPTQEVPSPPPEVQPSRLLRRVQRIRGFESPWEFGGNPLRRSIPHIPPPCAFCHSTLHGYLTCGRYYLLFHGKHHATFRQPRLSEIPSLDVIDSLPITMGRPSSLPKFVSQ